MIGRAFVLDQVTRMVGLRGLPSDPVSAKITVDEVVSALTQACWSEPHVKAAVDEWIYDSSLFPSPAEIRQQAWKVREQFVPQREPDGRMGPPLPMDLPPEFREQWARACRNQGRHNDLWRAIKQDLGVRNFEKVTWTQITEAILRLNSAPPPTPVTEADFERLNPTENLTKPEFCSPPHRPKRQAKKRRKIIERKSES